jgi:hypothetical protein
MYFTNCHTLQDLKAEYRRLAMLHHPDRGGDTATMQEINRQYSDALERLQAAHNATADEAHQKHETAAEFIRIVEILMKLDGLEVELCGSWLWIGGNTREHKEALKAAGCRWASKKHLWYWHPADEAPKHHRGNATMGEIRSKYGSTTLKKADDDITAA